MLTLLLLQISSSKQVRSEETLQSERTPVVQTDQPNSTPTQESITGRSSRFFSRWHQASELGVLPGLVRRPIATQVLDGPSRSRRQRQPVVKQLRDSSSASPPVILPEIELPTFALQSGGSPTPDYMLAAMSAPQVRLPCPTCGCSSREHQDV
jgi:hypothetical protein